MTRKSSLSLFNFAILFFRLSQERTIRIRQENEHQKTIDSLQRKISDIIKQYTKTIDELKRELENERLINQNHPTSRPTSVPDFTSV
jgi:glucosamine 6-phosphate synthetase-like amidotransferase/phosphosugar isomerase protein